MSDLYPAPISVDADIGNGIFVDEILTGLTETGG